MQEHVRLTKLFEEMLAAVLTIPTDTVVSTAQKHFGSYSTKAKIPKP